MLNRELPRIITDEVPGPKAKAILERRKKSTPGAIKCIYPCVMDEAQGAIIKDVDGNLFLDWIGGVGVLNVGHANPEVVEAIRKQSEKYLHGMFNVVTHEGYVELAEKMNQIVPVRGKMRKTMFANSGAEADENAVKIAKAYTRRPNIIVFSGAFHGRTMLTMAMTSKKSYALGMGPFPDGVYRAEYPYLYRKPIGLDDNEAIDYYVAKLRKVFEECSPAEYVAAVVLEPLQGEGGFIPAPIEWVKAVREICDENGILLVADEVQSGFGRTGKMFASDYWRENGFEPDILTAAKSIADGIPLSSITARSEIFDAVPDGVIGGTFGGNAVACAAALKVVQIIQRDNLCERSRIIGKRCMETFEKWKDKYGVVGDVRGMGGMVGIEFVKDKVSKAPNREFTSRLIDHAARKGLLLESAGTYGNVIRFLAPLVITDEQLECGFDIFEQSIKKCIYEY